MTMTKDIERRFVSFAEFRKHADQNTLRGHAATFGDVYDLGPFDERIAEGAFDNVMDDDVRALFNHDSNHVLGRTKAGTLRIETDDVGLLTEIDLPQSATMLREAIDRGDVDQMSFGFTVAADSWEITNEETGRELRTITQIGRLYDVSPVTFPANPNTDVALRSLEGFRAAQTETVTYSGSTGTVHDVVIDVSDDDEIEHEPVDPQFANKVRLDLL